jgi:[lysine-biosynthesis-protein LysW]--L-2-aminoadipate ligase
MVKVFFLYDVLRLDEKMLLDRLRARAQVEPLHVSSSILEIGGYAEADVALQRSISFYRAMSSTAAVESWGIRVINNSLALAMAEDKAWSLSVLYQHKIPVPHTLLAYSIDSAVEAARKLGFPVVMKPLMGSWGRLAALASDEEAARAIAEHREMLGSMYKVHYVQEYIDKPGRDIRAMCIGDRVPAAIYRVSNHWITNTARGGRAEPAKVDPILEDLVIRSCKALRVEVGGVDVVEDSERGYVVLEVNAVPEYKNIARVTGVDVADEIARYVVEQAKR